MEGLERALLGSLHPFQGPGRALPSSLRSSPLWFMEGKKLLLPESSPMLEAVHCEDVCAWHGSPMHPFLFRQFPSSTFPGSILELPLVSLLIHRAGRVFSFLGGGEQWLEEVSTLLVPLFSLDCRVNLHHSQCCFLHPVPSLVRRTLFAQA